MFLRFAREKQAVPEEVVKTLWEDGWKAILEIGERQALHQRNDDPVLRFFELINSAIASGSAYLADAKTGQHSTEARQWGWEESVWAQGEEEISTWKPKGKKIGWIDAEGILFLPDAAFGMAQRTASEQNYCIPIAQQTLWKRMAERGLLVKWKSRCRGEPRIAVYGKLLLREP